MPKEAESPLDRSPVPEPGEVTSPDPEPPATEHVPEKAPSVEPSLEIERTPLLMTPAPFPVEVSGRPSLVTRMPAKYGDYECYPLLTNGCLDPLIVSGNTSHLSSGGFMEKKTTMLWSQVVAHLKRLQENEKKQASYRQRTANWIPDRNVSPGTQSAQRLVNKWQLSPTKWIGNSRLYIEQTNLTRKHVAGCSATQGNFQYSGRESGLAGDRYQMTDEKVLQVIPANFHVLISDSMPTNGREYVMEVV